MGTRVKAREDLKLGEGFIKKGTFGEIQNSYDLAGGGQVHYIKWEQDGGTGPGTHRNSLDNEFEVIAE